MNLPLGLPLSDTLPMNVSLHQYSLSVCTLPAARPVKQPDHFSTKATVQLRRNSTFPLLLSFKVAVPPICAGPSTGAPPCTLILLPLILVEIRLVCSPGPIATDTDTNAQLFGSSLNILGIHLAIERVSCVVWIASRGSVHITWWSPTVNRWPIGYCAKPKAFGLAPTRSLCRGASVVDLSGGSDSENEVWPCPDPVPARLQAAGFHHSSLLETRANAALVTRDS